MSLRPVDEVWSGSGTSAWVARCSPRSTLTEERARIRDCYFEHGRVEARVRLSAIAAPSSSRQMRSGAFTLTIGSVVLDGGYVSGPSNSGRFSPPGTACCFLQPNRSMAAVKVEIAICEPIDPGAHHRPPIPPGTVDVGCRVGRRTIQITGRLRILGELCTEHFAVEMVADSARS